MEFIEVERNDFLLKVRLNRPQIHNAMNPKMIGEVTKLFKKIAAGKAQDIKGVRVVLLQGNGASFCAGADLAWMQESVKYTKAKNAADATALYNMFDAIAQCPVPVVGKLHGNVMGGGIGLAAVCDISAADIGTKFCFSEVRLGLVPAVISSFVLKKVVASGARELMLSARVFDCEQAEKIGLVNFGGRELEVNDFLRDTIDQFGKNGPEGVKATKKLLNDLATLPAAKVKGHTVKVIAERRTSKEGQEGLKAFLEKRKAKWVIENES